MATNVAVAADALKAAIIRYLEAHSDPLQPLECNVQGAQEKVQEFKERLTGAEFNDDKYWEIFELCEFMRKTLPGDCSLLGGCYGTTIHQCRIPLCVHWTNTDTGHSQDLEDILEEWKRSNTSIFAFFRELERLDTTVSDASRYIRRVLTILEQIIPLRTSFDRTGEPFSREFFFISSLALSFSLY